MGWVGLEEGLSLGPSSRGTLFPARWRLWNGRTRLSGLRSCDPGCHGTAVPTCLISKAGTTLRPPSEGGTRLRRKPAGHEGSVCLSPRRSRGQRGGHGSCPVGPPRRFISSPPPPGTSCPRWLLPFARVRLPDADAHPTRPKDHAAACRIPLPELRSSCLGLRLPVGCPCLLAPPEPVAEGGGSSPL